MMRLADLYLPLMAYVSDFEQHPAASVEDLSRRMNEQIVDIFRQGTSTGFTQETLEAGLFPVVAWIDERVLALRLWPDVKQWHRYLLQRQYFRTTLAGVEFFERLQSLGPKDNALRELYLLALSMGFLGQFARERILESQDRAATESARGWQSMPDFANDKLTRIRLEQFNLYKSAAGAETAGQSDFLFPFAYQNTATAGARATSRWHRVISNPRHLILLIVPPLLVILLAIVLNASLNKAIHNFLGSIVV